MSLDQRTSEEARPPQTVADDRLPRQVKLVLAVLLVAAFVMILNETIMGVAIESLTHELGVTYSTAQWLTTAFMLTMAVVIPTTGLILQRFSTRAVFLASMSLFATGTLLCAVAPGFGVLVAGRVVQASGTAVMLPLLTTTVLTFVPASRRGRTMGFIAIVISVAPAVGPTFSGLILSTLSWRWMFLSVLPIALGSLALGAALVRNMTTPKAVRFDLLSILLSALAFGGLIYGLSSIGKSAEGDTPVPPALPIVLGLVALAFFVWRQLRLQRGDAALLDLRPFRQRPFVLGLLVLLVSMGSLFGTLILLPLHLQGVVGMTELETGLLLLPGGLTMGLIAPWVGRLFDRFGPRPLVIPGTLVITTALTLMTRIDESATMAQVVAVHVILCAGLGLVMTPLMTSALGSLDMSLYSHGSAIVNTLQQLAGAAGTAVFMTIMTTRSAAHVREGMDPVLAQASGTQTAFLCGAALAAVGAGLSFLVRRTRQSGSDAPPAVH